MKAKKFSLKNKKEMENLMILESSLYYISFMGDAPVVKGEVTFTKKKVEEYYFNLLNHSINMFNEARSLKEKNKASEAFLTLQIIPLRIH